MDVNFPNEIHISQAKNQRGWKKYPVLPLFNSGIIKFMEVDTKVKLKKYKTYKIKFIF